MPNNILKIFKKIEHIKGLYEDVPDLSRRSAILIPVLCPRTDFENKILNILNWKLIFTIRSGHLKEHAGEVSFPGGRIDHGESPQQTALREANEEIALEPSKILSTIKLNDSFARSGYHIVPFCSLFIDDQNLRCNEDEVSFIIPLSIQDLLNINSWSEERSIMQLKRRVWHFPMNIKNVGDIDIWGATGNILKDFLIRIETLL
jgi:8-oxo-dGTP pyrophosphatase MutT (NUDIX family)